MCKVCLDGFSRRILSVKSLLDHLFHHGDIVHVPKKTIHLNDMLQRQSYHGMPFDMSLTSFRIRKLLHNFLTIILHFYLKRYVKFLSGINGDGSRLISAKDRGPVISKAMQKLLMWMSVGVSSSTGNDRKFRINLS